MALMLGIPQHSMAFPAATPCAPKPRCAPAAAVASWELGVGEPGHSPGTGGTSGNASPDKCLHFPSSSGDKLAHASHRHGRALCQGGQPFQAVRSTGESRVPQAVQHGEIPMFSRCRGGNLKETPVPSLVNGHNIHTQDRTQTLCCCSLSHRGNSEKTRTVTKMTFSCTY